MNRSIFALVALPLVACSSTLASLQPAAVLAKGEFHTGTGVALPVPAGAGLRAQESIDNGLAAQGLAEAALGAVANLPLPLTQTDVRIGLGHKVDAGVRLSTDAITLGAKYQFLGTPKAGGFDGSIGLELSRHFFSNNSYENLYNNADQQADNQADQAAVLNTNIDLFDLVLFGVRDVSRQDVMVPVLFGRQPTNWLNYWWGPKYSFSRVDLETVVEIKDGDTTVNENLHYLGGTAGVSFGYKKVWMVLELNAFNLIFKPQIGDTDFNAGGLVVFPALGFITRF